MGRSSKKPINVKRVFKLKLRANGEITKYKARLMEIGFLQKPSINFNKVYAPIARLKTIRIVVSTPTYKGGKIHQLNVK